MQKFKYYNLKKILSYDALYNVIIGERSNGKTFSVLEYALRKYIENGEQLAIVRRWGDDFRGKNGVQLYDGISDKGLVEKLTGGKWTFISYYAKRWFLSRMEDDQIVRSPDPLAFAFAITSMEHDKSSSYPRVTTIMFDEFLTRRGYLPDEFILFTNVISTIVRLETKCKIFMIGNTVNRYCPYFKEMGLTHIKDQKLGTIDLYTYGDSGLTVAVEMCESSPKDSKPSNKYFAFNNPKLKMITGGEWEIAVYPHCPHKYKPKDVIFKYTVDFEGDVLTAEIVRQPEINSDFTFIHRKTTPIKEDDTLIYSPQYRPQRNWRRKITAPTTKLERKILSYFARDKVFYQDNEIGEIMRNYIKWCQMEANE